MKQLITLFLIIQLTAPHLYSQPTQAEIDKMMKMAQDQMNKYGKDTAATRIFKEMQSSSTLKTNTKSGTNYEKGSLPAVESWTLPGRNNKLLSSLPKKILTKTEVVSLINNTYSQLQKKMDAGIHSSVQAIAASVNNDAFKMGQAAVVGWYSEHKEESILLILKAAASAPDDLLLLNNCAALLNLGGVEQLSIPILKYILQQEPESAMALNNIGQAYTGLGETDTAMYYFGMCMRIMPQHPEACNTVAMIEASRGNRERATENLERSLGSSYSQSAEQLLGKLKAKFKMINLVRPRVRYPIYFNLFKYDVPPQCLSVQTAEYSDAEHKAFRAMIMKQAQSFGVEYQELTLKKMNQSMNSKGYGRALNKDEFMAQPFYDLCATMAKEVNAEYEAELKRLATQVDKNFFAEMKVLETAYQGRVEALKAFYAKKAKECCGDSKTMPLDCCPTGEGQCEAFNDIANEFLPRFADLTEPWQREHLRVFKQYFDELSYWHYLTLKPTGIDNFKIWYLQLIQKYLVTVGQVAQTKIIRKCEPVPASASAQNKDIKPYDCPLDFDITFLIGEIELNCDKFSMGGGEVLRFKYEKFFRTGESTLGIGIGVGISAGKLDLGLEELAFVKFDRNGRCSDAGIKMEATTGVSAGPVGVQSEVGYTLGVSSGFTFDEGPFKSMMNPQEVQIKRSVPIYKPN